MNEAADRERLYTPSCSWERDIWIERGKERESDRARERGRERKLASEKERERLRGRERVRQME